MIYEACELLAKHLQDGAMGVNALRQSVPLDVNDPPIEFVTVKHEFEVAYLAGGRLPEGIYDSGPLVLVRSADDAGEYSAPGSPEILDDPSRVGIAIPVFFPRRRLRDLHQENRCMSALLRVVRRSVGMFFENVAVTDRDLRHVQLTGLLDGIRVVRTVALVGETDLLAGAVLMNIKALDRWAEGITP
ncbi:MAG: hypothetical protein ACYC0B_02085 [Gemmatimonadaceae bacterium]